MTKLLSIEAAAELLSISKWTVRSYVRAGKLRPVRIGRRVLLAEAELEQFIVRSQQPAETHPDASQSRDNTPEATR